MRKILYISLLVIVLVSSCQSAANTPTQEVDKVATDAPTPIVESTPTAEPVQEVVHLKLGYQPFLSSAPLFIASDGGFFAEQGLDVELVRFKSGSDVLTAMLAGEIDLSAENLSAGAINAIAQTAGYKFVGERGFVDPTAECSYQVFVARSDLLKDGFLDDPANVKGLKFATTPASVFEYGVDVELAKLGLSRDDVQFVSMASQPERLEALKTGALDIVTYSEPWITRAKNSGAADVWLPFETVVPNVPTSVVLYGPKLTGDNSDIGDRFMIAYLKAIRQYHEGKIDSNVSIISKYTELSAEDVKSACWPTVAADGRTHLDTWMPYQEWLVSKGYLDATVSTDILWDPQYVDFANEALK
jgi:NitT/TauT family transport system substrate-binding protein